MSLSTSKRPKRTGQKPSVGSAGAVAAKPSLYQRYMSIPTKWKVYIWGTTFVVAFAANSISDKILEKNMIDAEAERRVDLELQKQDKSATSE